MEEEKDDGIIPVPECLKDLVNKLAGVTNIMERFSEMRWGYKNARKAAIERQELRVEFWEKLFDLKPKLKNKAMSLDCDRMEMRIEEKKS